MSDRQPVMDVNAVVSEVDDQRLDGPTSGRPWPDVASSTGDYASRFSGDVGQHFLDVQLDGVLTGLEGGAAPSEESSPETTSSVLDVGGGHAQLAAPLVAHGRAVTVLGSEASCEARVAASIADGEYRFVEGPLYPLPFADASFDAVVAVRMLAHLDDARAFVSELCRVARHTVIVDFPVQRLWDSLGWFGFALKKGVERNTRPFHAFRSREIEDLFVASGFEVTRRDRQFALPMALHRAVGRVGITRTSEAIARSVGLARLVGSPVLMTAVRSATNGTAMRGDI